MQWRNSRLAPFCLKIDLKFGKFFHQFLWLKRLADEVIHPGTETLIPVFFKCVGSKCQDHRLFDL